MVDDSYEAELPRFSAAMNDDYHYWSMSIKPGLRSREVTAESTNNGATAITSKPALVIVNNGLGDNPLSTTKDF